MPRLRQVPRDQAHPAAQKLYEMIFGDRDPITQPGTATGTPSIVRFTRSAIKNPLSFCLFNLRFSIFD